MESSLPPLLNETVSWTSGLLWFAIAFYLGKPAPNEKPFAAFARALGYANESELNAAIEKKSSGPVHSFSSPLKNEYAKSLEFLYPRSTSTTIPARHDFGKIRSECTLACLGRIKNNSTEWCWCNGLILRGCGSTMVTILDGTSAVSRKSRVFTRDDPDPVRAWSGWSRPWTRTAVVPGCGYASGTSRRVRPPGHNWQRRCAGFATGTKIRPITAERSPNPDQVQDARTATPPA